MNKIVLNAEIVSQINYLYKHLFDDPAKNPTNTPKIAPNGTKIANISQIANILGVETKIAAHFVLQDPNADPSLKFLAKEEIRPGIYVPAEDSFIPVLHQAYEIINSPIDTEEKGIRLVRTVAGVRRFRQKRGSIIVNDGANPLDAIQALPNDVAGYEKIADSSGKVYYIGNENGNWVVRDPASNTIIHSAGTEEESFGWLNTHAGGSEKPTQTGTQKPTESQRVLSHPSPIQQRNIDKGTVAKDHTLNRQQAVDVVKLTTEQLQLYAVLKSRGLSHVQAMAIVKRNVVPLKPKVKNAGK